MQAFIQDCLDQIVIADLLDEKDVDECKNIAKILKTKNDEADSHTTGSKLALKKYTKNLG